jgi:quinol monooxygenase YgiN/MFS family permease
VSVGVVATWVPLEGREDEVGALLMDMQAATRGEEGCLLYELHRVPEGFLLYEQYVDAGAIERHHATPHYRALVLGRAPELLARRDVVRGEVLLGPALAVRDFQLWWLAVLGMNLSLQMLEVAIGWQVYADHGRALDLGLIGLAEFVPMFVFALPAGQLADRLPRRLIFGVALLIGAGLGVGLAALSAADVTATPPYFAMAVGAGIVMVLGNPAARAMPPTLVSAELLPSAMTLRSIAVQSAQVVGPAIGGLLYGTTRVGVYLVTAAMALGAAACVGAMAPQPAADPAVEPAGGRAAGRGSGVDGVLEGLRFVGRTPILLGSILLDLLAVLFGGAVALLPVFAKTVLHVGPTALGILRAAPAVGALAGSVWITKRPLVRHAGRTLLTVVAAYGVCIVVFGLSRSYWLSMAALIASGFVDMFSVNVRNVIVALATPDRLRGRVGAVEMVFISASNQLGAFESGLAAALVGAVPAVVFGGAMTVAIALGWGRIFPSLARVDRMHELRPEEDRPRVEVVG